MTDDELQLLASRLGDILLPQLVEAIVARLTQMIASHDEFANNVSQLVVGQLSAKQSKKDHITTTEACCIMGCSRRKLCALKTKYPFIGFGYGKHGYSAQGLAKLKELKNCGKLIN